MGLFTELPPLSDCTADLKYILFFGSGLYFDVRSGLLADLMKGLFWYLAIVGAYTISA